MVTMGGAGFDMVLIEFIKGNLFTIGLVLFFLKGIAVITPGTLDNKMVTLLTNTFNYAQSGISNTASAVKSKVLGSQPQSKEEVDEKPKD